MFAELDSIDGLGEAFALVVLSGAVAGGAALYFMTGGKNAAWTKKRIAMVSGAALLTPVAMGAYGRAKSKTDAVKLRACIDTYCNANPTHCKRGAKDGVWYMDAPYQPRCFH